MDNKETLINHIEDKVPKLRFPEFTDPWEQRKLGDFGKATGGTSIESEFSKDGKYKVISIGSYSENSIYNDQGIRAIESDKTSNLVLNRNDLTMILNDKTTSGNIIGRMLLIEKSGIYVYNQRTERIETNLDEYDSVFLYEMLNAPNIRAKIIKQAQGNTQIYVNWTTISLLDYMIPSKEEQVKIGKYLHDISNLITLHQRKLILLNKYKRGLISLTFSNKNGCKEFKLKELLQPYTSKNTSLYEPVAVGKYGIRKRSEIYSKILSKDISKNKVIEKNTFVIGMGSKQIDFGILYEDVKYSVSPAYLTFKISKKINPKYLEEYLRNILPILSFKFMIIGARQGKNIDKEGFLNYSIYVPSIDRQNRISDTLIALDKKIEKENELLLLLKQYKQGLLQQMFI